MSLKNPVIPPGIDPGTVRLVAQRLNHYATPGPPLRIKYVLITVSTSVLVTNLQNENMCNSLRNYQCPPNIEKLLIDNFLNFEMHVPEI